MFLSIVVPSHGSDLHTYSRILHACEFASDHIEVVIRDNSGVPAKHEFLKQMSRENCRIVTADPCGPFENFTKAAAAATGEFLFIVSDDDYFFDRAIASLLAAAEAYEGDRTVAGITGTYVLELSAGSQFVNYRGLDLRDAAERVGGYLDYQGPNLIGYAAMRRDVALDAWQLIHAHPVEFSFHDQLFSLLSLLAGRFVHTNRLLFCYDNAHWENVERAAEVDLKYYMRAGIDPAFGRLHWLLLGFEGARLIVNSRFGARLGASERQRAATRWFQTMFARFAGDKRGNYGSELGGHADAIANKWRSRYPNIALDELLNDICAFMQLFSPEMADRYRAFWSVLARESLAEATTPA